MGRPGKRAKVDQPSGGELARALNWLNSYNKVRDHEQWKRSARAGCTPAGRRSCGPGPCLLAGIQSRKQAHNCTQEASAAARGRLLAPPPPPAPTPPPPPPNLPTPAAAPAAQVSKWMAQYDLNALVDSGGGIVKVSNFLPPFVAEGALQILQRLPPGRWNDTAADEVGRELAAARVVGAGRIHSILMNMLCFQILVGQGRSRVLHELHHQVAQQAHAVGLLS